MLNKIKGQSKVISSLLNAIEVNRVGQSYLFYGPEGIGKLTTALYFVMAINCLNEEEGCPCGICDSCRKFLNLSHPDLIYIFPTPNLKLSSDGEIKDSKYQAEYAEYINNKINSPWKSYKFSAASEIRIDSIRMLQQRLNLTKNEAKTRVCIIEDADLMNNNTANAFLKTLEEPPENTIIILTTSKENKLLPTILSRCQKVAFKNLSKDTISSILVEEFQVDSRKANILARISYGNAEKAIQLIDEDLDSGRKIAQMIIQYSLKKDDLSFIAYLEEIKSLKQKKYLKNIWFNIVIILMDLIYLSESPDNVINIDSKDLLEELLNKKSTFTEDVYKLVDYTNSINEMIDLNTVPALILTTIYHKLKKIFN